MIQLCKKPKFIIVSFFNKAKIKSLIALKILITLKINQSKNKRFGATPNNQVRMKNVKQRILHYTPISRLLQKMERNNS